MAAGTGHNRRGAHGPVQHDERFDAAYYRRFYGSSPVHDRRRIAVLATAVTAWAAWWRVPIRSVLDVGAGRGYWRSWFAEHRPQVRYHGLDVSAHACARHGHELADIATWQPSRPYDLVVCQSVLQYLSDDALPGAIRTLGVACRGLLYLEVPTSADRDTVIDPQRTDMDVHWRPGSTYRDLLAEAFIFVGGGIWASRAAGAIFFELEISG